MQILVLGMHRSGTSAVARLLNLMGAYFGGENVGIGASAENTKGFWERLDVRALNDSMLHNANCDWDRIAELDLDAIPGDFLDAYHRSVRDIVLKLDAHRPWFIKEPRLCVLLPLWRPALELPFCVHVFRHPLEVAYSLKARNGMPIQVGLALWEAYNTKAIESSSDLPRFFLSYSELLSSPVPVAGQLREAMSRSGGYEFRAPSNAELSGSLDGNLRHQRYEDATPGLPCGSQLALYERLLDARATGAAAAPSLPPSCLATLRRFESSGEHLAARMRRSNAKRRAGDQDSNPRLALKSMQLDQALKAVADKSNALADAAQSNATLTDELNKRNTDLALQKEEIARLTADLDHGRNVLAERAGKIQELTAELEKRAAALAAKDGAVAELRAQTTRYESALGMRDADIQHLSREIAASSVTVARLQDELSQLRDRTERAVKRITDENVGIADENRSLRRQRETADANAARLKSEADALKTRHRDLAVAVDAVLRSRRWRLGNILLSLPYRLLLRRVPPMATDTIKRIAEVVDR